jgi:hypothetical protein
MISQPSQSRPGLAAVSPEEAPTCFLVDWRPDQRELPVEGRIAAGLYIDAIVTRAAYADPAAEGEARLVLWTRFRNLYDGLLGPYSRGAQDDIRRAISRL